MNRTAFRETGLSGMFALRPAVPNLFQSATSTVTKCDKHCYKVRQLYKYNVQMLLYYKARQLFNSAAIISKCETTDLYASFGVAICKKKKQRKSCL